MDNEFVVERIVKHRKAKKSKKYQYLIKWKGFPDSENTWEPEDNIIDATLITSYWRTLNKNKTKKTKTANDQSEKNSDLTNQSSGDENKNEIKILGIRKINNEVEYAAKNSEGEVFSIKKFNKNIYLNNIVDWFEKLYLEQNDKKDNNN